MKHAIIIGASSGIGYQIAKLLAHEGWSVGIAARRAQRLEQLANEKPENIFTETIDITKENAIQQLRLLIEKTGGIDLLVHAAGIGKQNPELNADIEIQTLQTNATAFTRIIGEAFRIMEQKGGGHIAVISSIAGTKGLGPAPAYSATKAFQNTYIQALSQLANSRKLNITFTDIRPGFVDTDLLNNHKQYPMLMNAEKVAKQAIKAIKKRKNVHIIDWRWRIITAGWKCIPQSIWRKIKLI